MADNLLADRQGHALLVKLVAVMTLKLDAALEPAFLDELDEHNLPKRNPNHIPMSPAEMTAIIKLLSDNSITIAAITRGDFGKVAQAAAEEFPFPDSPTVVPFDRESGWGRA